MAQKNEVNFFGYKNHIKTDQGTKLIAGSAVPFVAGWFGWPYLPPIIAFDAVVAWSVWRLLDHRTLPKLRYIRRIYLAGTAMLLALIGIRLAAG